MTSEGYCKGVFGVRNQEHFAERHLHRSSGSQESARLNRSVGCSSQLVSENSVSARSPLGSSAQSQGRALASAPRGTGLLPRALRSAV